MKTRILIAEDHALVRSGLRLLIECHADLEVIGEASNGQEALALVQSAQPEIVVLDLSMPVLGGLEFLQELGRRPTAPRVLVLTANKDTSYLSRVFELGASGYVHKQSAAEDLILAIRTVARGHRFFPGGEGQRFTPKTPCVPEPDRQAFTLSERERLVLFQIAQGKTNREIAANLDLSVKTVETYKARAMQKLQLRGRVDIVRFAVQHGWLSEG